MIAVVILACAAISIAMTVGVRLGHRAGYREGRAAGRALTEAWRASLRWDEGPHEITGTWADPTELFIADLDRTLSEIESERTRAAKDAEWNRIKQKQGRATRRGQFTPID